MRHGGEERDMVQGTCFLNEMCPELGVIADMGIES